MKKLLILMLTIASIFFIDYFLISIVGVVASFCNAGCGFYESTFGFISWIIIGSSILLTSLIYAKKNVTT